MTTRPAPPRRFLALTTVLLLLGPAGCRQEKSAADGGDKARSRPVFCFRELDRPGPGQLVLREPLDCQQPVARYRAEGRRDRPEAIDYLTAEGLIRMSYRLKYADDGRPVREERILFQKPTRFRLFNQGDRISFSSKPGQSWQVVRILTSLDQRGQPVQMEKYVGAKRSYRVQREYDDDGHLVRESTFDGQDRLKIQSSWMREGTAWHETMRNGDGQVLLDRVLPPGVAPGDDPTPPAEPSAPDAGTTAPPPTRTRQ